MIFYNGLKTYNYHGKIGCISNMEMDLKRHYCLWTMGYNR